MELTIISTIFVFGLLVTFHELGHFITAKLTGMLVEEFALGFGPKILGFQKGETIYSLRAIPLGGYNKIAGMDPDELQNERSFQKKSLGARMLVIVAGSAMNFVLPILLFTMIIISSGIDTPSEQPVIGKLLPGKSAAQAGLLVGDKILSIENQQIDNWKQLITHIQHNSGIPLRITYERNGAPLQTVIVPEHDAKAGRALIGIAPQISHRDPGIGESITLAIQQTYQTSEMMVIGIVQMLTGQVSAEVSGPIGIARMAGEMAQLGFIPLLQFAAFLSINLGLLNLLPVPPLDGGHIITLLMEGLYGKPLNRKILQATQMIGFALLMLLLILATTKDIQRAW